MCLFLVKQPRNGVCILQRDKPIAKTNSLPKPPDKQHPKSNLEVPGVADAEMDTGSETPNKASPSDHYVVLRNLVLPRPPAELKDRAQLYEKDLRALDARDMKRGFK